MEEFAFDMDRRSPILSNWQDAIIDLKVIQTLLNYDDARSVLKWCKDNNVFVLSQGNTKVVNVIEFILAFYKPYLEHLKRTQQDWKTRFWDYVSINIAEVLNENRERNPSRYTPKTSIETSFLKKIKNL